MQKQVKVTIRFPMFDPYPGCVRPQGFIRTTHVDLTLEEAFIVIVVARDLFVHSRPCWEGQYGLIHSIPL